jgi:hypothetical protein
LQSFVAIACLLAGIALTVTTLALLVRRAWRQLAVANAYREVALLLGLEIDTRGVSIRGHLAGRRVWVGELLEWRGTQRRRRTRGIVGFERPLGLGLHIRRRGRPDHLRRKRSHQVILGDAALDSLLTVHADEPLLARRLLTPPVREALIALTTQWPDMSIDDMEVQVQLRYPEASPAGLHRLVQSLLEVAASLEGARREMPPPTSMRGLHEPWTQFAEAWQLSFDPSLPAIQGLHGPYRLLVTPRRERHGMRAAITVAFPDFPHTGLHLRPRNGPAHGQDIAIGDARFRSTFIVKGHNPEAIARRLGPEAQATLVLLAARGPTRADDVALTISDLEPETGTLDATLRLALRCAEELHYGTATSAYSEPEY